MMVESNVQTADREAVNGNEKADEMAAVARILLDSIPPDKKQQNAFKVMAYLAEKTIAGASEDRAGPKIPTKQIHLDVGTNPNRDASAWVSPLWKEIEEKWYPAIKENVIARCRDAGLNVYPILRKMEGKPAFYWIEAEEISKEESAITPFESEMDSTPEAITYTKDLALQLSFAGRLFFQEGMRWTAAKRYSFITWQLVYLTMVLIYIAAILLVLWNKKGPLGGQELVMLIMGFFVSGLAYRHGAAVWKLFDDRIIVAPDWTIAWKETGATIEINRSNNPDVPGTIHVNRYSTKCPICGWMVKLDKGEPEFPRRIVGRCEENPREHVFSFDRSTKLGVPLRAYSSRDKN
ncbi:hypothetical protein [Noviherbaspirillum pedocola]|uniref:Uncharacterized protein n=1 Tax=Noviherbaspirillum pedocola TaxID=2801341 RepID=A0A934W9H0_9BURK|nr:hypothetical protein [Noviherbaspirillum pedocola]MBK4738895.1 hypothetical protein [Noviherbaspirillum pedocola]